MNDIDLRRMLAYVMQVCCNTWVLQWKKKRENMNKNRRITRKNEAEQGILKRRFFFSPGWMYPICLQDIFFAHTEFTIANALVPSRLTALAGANGMITSSWWYCQWYSIFDTSFSRGILPHSSYTRSQRTRFIREHALNKMHLVPLARLNHFPSFSR